MKKIFIVEDEENIRDLVIYALNANGFICEGFINANELFSELKSSTPDLILLDIMLPDTNGLTILKKIRSDSTINNIPVILLTAKSSEYDKVKGLDLGADDYITKPFSVLELISRIKALLRRSNQTNNTKSSSIISYKDIKIDNDKHTVSIDDVEIYFTFKEFELLNYLLNNVGIVLSRDKLMEKVWGFDYEGESRTVDMHIKSIRQKLGDKSYIIETVRGVGYKIGE